VEDILAYISERNPSAAATVVEGILARVELLKALPRMGKPYTARNDQEIRQLVSGKYRIFYAIATAANRVEILTVWHGARPEPDLSE
jgi:plasmid stabilization system protein ParE